MARTKRRYTRIDLPPGFFQEMARLEKEVKILESRNIFDSVHREVLNRYKAELESLHQPAMPELEEGD
jgi:hypothetical protein